MGQMSTCVRYWEGLSAHEDYEMAIPDQAHCRRLIRRAVPTPLLTQNRGRSVAGSSACRWTSIFLEHSSLPAHTNPEKVCPEDFHLECLGLFVLRRYECIRLSPWPDLLPKTVQYRTSAGCRVHKNDRSM